MQKIAALSNLVAYYCIALPVGAALMFEAQLKILGNYSAILLNCCLYLLDHRVEETSVELELLLLF